MESKPSGTASSNGPKYLMSPPPALLTRTSRPPICPAASSTMATAARASVRSHRVDRRPAAVELRISSATSSSCAAVREASATCAPCGHQQRDRPADAAPRAGHTLACPHRRTSASLLARGRAPSAARLGGSGPVDRDLVDSEFEQVARVARVVFATRPWREPVGDDLPRQRRHQYAAAVVAGVHQQPLVHSGGGR